MTTARAIIESFIRLQGEGGFGSHLGGAQRYAFEVSSIKERLMYQGSSKAQGVLEAIDTPFCFDVLAFEDTSAAATYNPHRPLEDGPYFVETKTLKELDVLIPNEEGKVLVPSVVHIGNKGSGKTTTQNHWLATRHELLERRKTFYVRCDAPKLFEFFHEDPDLTVWDTNVMPTIEEYLDLQLVYILGKRMDRGLPKTIVDALDASKATFTYKVARSADAPDRDEQPIAWFLKGHVKTAIAVFETGDQNRSYVRHSLFKDKRTRRREYTRWTECAGAIKSWLHANGYKLLHILDGVDNLHLNTQVGIRVYRAFLPLVTQFVSRRPPDGQLRLAAMRYRTWMDAAKKDPITSGSPMVITPRQISHQVPQLVDVATKRFEWMKTRVGVPSGLRPAAEALRAAADAMPDREVLHDNLRNWVAGTASLARQIQVRRYQLDREWDGSYRRQAAVQMKRNLFLNGRLFLETEMDWPQMDRERGLPFFNPFWVSEDAILAGSGPSGVLLKVRLLEFLYQESRFDDALIKVLVASFSYTQDEVRMAIDDLRAFGLIDSLLSNERIAYRINKAGTYLLRELLVDLDVLYILALDTRLPSEFFEQELVRVHTNHIHERSEYAMAAVTTVLTFLLWLTTICRRDLLQHGQAMERTGYRQVFLSKQHVEGLFERIERLISIASDSDLLAMRSAHEALIQLVASSHGR